MKTIKEWVLKNYEESTIKDITNYGMIGGFNNLTTYDETVAFHDKYEEEIWDMLEQDAQNEGCSIMELIAQFNKQDTIGAMYQLKNNLAWYAVERVCQQILDEKEETQE